jgi:hypothetical protein
MKPPSKMYNPYNLEASFKNYLELQNYSRSSIQNYLTDIRSFLSWFSHNLRAQHLEFSFSNFNQNSINRYVDYLQVSHTPVESINRTLSSLRLFSNLLLSKSYIADNPLVTIKNVKVTPFNSAVYWLKRNAKLIFSFVFGFIFVSLLFIAPTLVSSTITRLSDKNTLLLQDTQDISAKFANFPNASTSADILTIPIVDSNGALNLTAPYPKIIGQTGVLSIEAPELSLAAYAQGNLKLQTEEGSVHFIFNGEKPNLPFESAFYFTAENMKSGTLILGEVERISDDVSLLELSSGSPSTSKFRVDSEGNVYVKGNIILEGNLIVNPESTIFGTFSNQTATSSASSIY